MRTAARLATLCVCISASCASAADVGLKSSLIQSIDANSNYQLQPVSPGPTYAPVSTLIFDGLVRTPTMRFTASANLSYRSYFGPGAENLLAGLDRVFRGSAEKRDELTTYKLEGGTSTRAASQVSLEETGQIITSGDLTTSYIDGGIQRQLSYLDQVSVSTRATRTQKSGSSSFDSQDLLVMGSWTRRIDSLTELIPTIQYEMLRSEQIGSSQASEFEIWRGLMGFSSRPTKRLTISGGIGVAALTVVSGATAVASNGSIVIPTGAGTAYDWIGNLQLTYQVNSTDTFSLAAAQSIGPDSLSVIRKFDVIGAVYRHRINRQAAVSFAADYSHQPSSTRAVNDLYSAGVSFDYQLTREWFATTSYRYRVRVAEENAQSHGFFASLRRDVTIIGSEGGQEARATPTDVGRLLSWPAAWIRPWRDSGVWQR